MADMSDAEMNELFEREYLGNPVLRARYDSYNEERKAETRRAWIARRREGIAEEDARAQAQADTNAQTEQNTDTATREDMPTGGDNQENVDNAPAPTEQPRENAAETPTSNYNSDEWQQLLSGENTEFLSTAPMQKGIDREVLRGMNKLPQNFDSLDFEHQQSAINTAKADLKPEEVQQFNEKEVELKKAIAEQYPPKRLVDTSKQLEEAEKHVRDDNVKQSMTNTRAAIMETMIGNINRFANGETVVDQSNIADVYDGSMEMYQYVEEKKPKDEELKQKLETCRGKMNAEIEKYDEANGFQSLSPKDAAEINATYLRAQKQCQDNEKFNPIKTTSNDGKLVSTESLWLAVEFSDEAKREELIASFNEAVKEKAARSVAVRNKGAKGEKLDEALQGEIDVTFAEEFERMIVTNETAKFAEAEAQKHQKDPSYEPQPYPADRAGADVQNAVSTITSGKKYKVDNKAVVTGFAHHTNEGFGYLNRLGSKIGKETNAVGHMAEGLRKLDNTCIKRFDPYYTIAKTQAKAIRGNIGRQALNQLARYGSSFIPGGNLLYAGYVGGQAAWRLGTKYRRLKKEAKANNRAFSGWKFLKDHAGEIATSAAATVAAGLGGGMAAGLLGKASMAIGSATNFIKTFKRQREKGETWKKSLGVAAFSVACSAASAIGTSSALGYGMHETGLDVQGHHNETVTDHNRIEELKNTAPEKLEEMGIVREHGVDPNAEGAFKVSDGKAGFETRDYSAEELKYAEMRNDGVRYSEYLDKQWVHHDYQDPNSSDPLAHSEDAHQNAIQALDKLAETHKDMSSYVDGKFESNSEMLLYKLYQANVLAPNPDAVSDSGQPIGEVLSATDKDGNVVNYQDVFQKALHGEELTETDYQVIHKVEDHVGGQLSVDENGNTTLNDVGKIKDFDHTGDGSRPVDSYNKDADPGYEPNQHPAEDPIYDRFVENKTDYREVLPFVVVHDNQGENRSLAQRIGANPHDLAEQAKKRVKDKQKDQVPTPVPVPVKQENQDKVPVATPVTKQEEKSGYGKLLADEYKIMYGVEPKVVDSKDPNEHRQYQHWINYNNRVDEERKAKYPDNKVDMYDFLTERRQKLDKTIEDAKAAKINVAGRSLEGSEVAKDYAKHQDNPGMSAVICGARESLMQSNLTSQNYNNKLTLSHFTEYVGHYAQSDEFVSDGTRDIQQNPQKNMKRDIVDEKTNPNKSYLVLDLNDYYLGSKDRKPYECFNVDPKKAEGQGVKTDRCTVKDVLKKMRFISMKHPKNPSMVQKEQKTL